MEENSLTAMDADDAPSAPPQADGAEQRGPLLDEPDPKKVVAAVVRNWKVQDEWLSKDLAQVAQAEGWRSGERWVYLRQGNNDRQWEVWRPPGVERLPALPDKVDELCRRLAAQMLVDEPILEAEPSKGDEECRESAEMASRILNIEGGENGWNFRLVTEGGIDLSTTQKSAFAHVRVNPVGGGQRPVTVMAHPQCQQYDQANPVACTLGPPGMDPTTGQPTPPAPSSDLVTKYLEADGTTLTEQETATTQRRWMPKITVRVLGMRHVRFLPAFCRGVEDADGLLVTDFVSVGELKQWYPETVGAMDTAALRKLVNWKGQTEETHELLLPRGIRDPKLVGTWIDKETVPDDAIALVAWEYHRQSPTYPKGACVCVGGGDQVLAQHTLEEQVERGDGSTVPEVLEMPVSQCRCLNDWVGGSPYGEALVTKLGPWNEMMGQQWVAVQEWLDRSNNPFMFIPLGSNVQPDQVAVRDGRPILVSPEGAPVMETVQQLGMDVKEWYDRAVAGANSTSGLQEVAQGVNTPNINSGTQADTVIQQSLVALASMQANATNFLTRLGRLILQRLRAHMSVPQTIRYVGDDGSYRADEWRGADLFGSTDVTLKRGSFTGMRPEHKQALILQMANPQFPIISLDDARDMLIDRFTASTGMEDDPVRLRIKRQLHGVRKRGAGFTRIAADLVPNIAHLRFRELARFEMSTDFARLAPEGQQAVSAETEAMRQAAGILTKQEESAGQQAQVTAQKELEQTKAAAKTQGDLQTLDKEQAFELQKIELEAGLAQQVQGAEALEATEVAKAQAQAGPAPQPIHLHVEDGGKSVRRRPTVKTTRIVRDESGAIVGAETVTEEPQDEAAPAPVMAHGPA